MGQTIININAPVTKLTSGILLLSEKETHRPDMMDCIRCGKCVDACPMGLRPFLIGICLRNNMIDELKNIHVMDCIECGCCAYICPAHIPLLDFCKLSKIEIRKKQKGK